MERASFSTLLGWADFSESLFAQSRAVDEIKQYSVYGNSLQAKLADVNSRVRQINQQAATAGVVVETSADVTLTADYYGAIDPAGQLPLDITFDVKLLGTSVLADPRLQIDYTADGLVGSETAPGTWTVTATTKLEGRLEIKVTFAGVVQGIWRVYTTTTKAAAPIPPPPDPDIPPPPPPPPGTPPAQTETQGVSLISPTNDGAFTLLGSADVEGGWSYRLSLASSIFPASNQLGESNVEVYLAKKAAGGSWQQEGLAVTGEPAVVYQLFDDSNPSIRTFVRETLPGYISISRDFVLPSGSYTLGIFGRLTTLLPANIDGAALLEAL